MKKTLKSMADTDITKLLSDCQSLKPKDLILDPLKWKYLVRSVLRGKNILFVGPSREGKTTAVFSVAKALNREDKLFVFNCGSAQDARALFIGNTFFSKDKGGTWFNKSEFVRAIETPNAIIILDELSRLTHDGANVLIPVLDPTQRTLRLDESENSIVIPVAKGVTFIATANVGNEYTATRVMDLALTNRFPVVVEMEPLGFDEMASLIGVKFPNADQNQLESMLVLCHISDDTKIQVKLDNAKITKFIPTGTIVEAAELVMDGFDLNEIAKMVVYPAYEDAGGADSERLFATQLVQKYTDKKSAAASSPINSPTGKKTVINF